MGLAFDLEGNLYVSDNQDNSIIRIEGFPQGLIQGTIVDHHSGRPLAGAQVHVRSGYPWVVGAQVVADGGGAYSVQAAPGIYSVTALAEGYCGATVDDVAVSADHTIPQDVRLEPCVQLPLVASGR